MQLTPLRIEKLAPAIVALALSLCSLLLGPHLKIHIAQELANPIITILAINTGFMAAAITIMLTVPTKQSFQQIKSAGYWEIIINYQWQAIISGLVAAMLSLCVLIVCKEFEHFYQSGFFFAWAASVGWAFTAFVRAASILKRLLI